MRHGTYQQQLDTIVSHAWETWTLNGLNMDADERRETEQTVYDKANNAYYEGIDEIVWLNETLRRLGCK